MEDSVKQNISKKIISSELERMHNNLYQKLLKEPCLKHIKTISMQEILNSITGSSNPQKIKEEKLKTKMLCVEYRAFTQSIDNAIMKLIDEGFSSSYRKELQMKLVKALQNVELPENKNCSNITNSKPNSTPEKDAASKDIEELMNMSKHCVEDLREISKEVIEMPLQEMKKQASISSQKVEGISSIFSLKKDDSGDEDVDQDRVSTLSVSSVHTSELSSFDDEISISSDEATGRKRKKLSLKQISKDIEPHKRIKATSPVDDSKATNQERSIGTVPPDHSKNPTDDLQDVQQKRARRPNSKYISEEMISPFSINLMDNEEQGYEDSASNELKTPRKRGRPRKVFN